jgi:crotonobetainyl-CoA:carnitine CoA-transferase CaiB-like acyl-CoA transferase
VALPARRHAVRLAAADLTGFHPLEAVRVLDLTSSLAGPYCTQILAALGADVVKVQHPGRGDEARAWGLAFAAGGSVMFFAANAGKRSLALDVSTEAGREALLRLAERSLVFVQSLRPRAAERLGLGPAHLRARNDRLIYCSIGARLRPADQGGRRDHERDRRAGDGDRVSYESAPPRLGEHSAEVLAEAGYSDAEISELATAGVTRLEGRRPP